MNPAKSSAPGKLVLSGEYAVLNGAPAVSMAVSRRAIVTLREADQLLLQSVGLAANSDSSLFECVCKVLGTGDWRGAATLDTSAFADSVSGNKLGIGSSAALTVSLVRALAAEDLSELELFRCSQEAHHAFQNGVGSGVDIATSIVGGLIEYRMGEFPKSIDWPKDLYYQILWSGVPASTSEKLRRLARKSPTDRGADLQEAAEKVASVWNDGIAKTLLVEYRDYIRALRRFDLDHGLGIFEAGHDALAECSMPTEIVYKPCGAGGGDIGVVLGTDKQAVDAFSARAVALGFRSMDMTIDPTGVVLCGIQT